jgi:hypothetical protein
MTRYLLDRLTSLDSNGAFPESCLVDQAEKSTTIYNFLTGAQGVRLFRCYEYSFGHNLIDVLMACGIICPDNID